MILEIYWFCVSADARDVARLSVIVILVSEGILVVVKLNCIFRFWVYSVVGITEQS